MGDIATLDGALGELRARVRGGGGHSIAGLSASGVGVLWADVDREMQPLTRVSERW